MNHKKREQTILITGGTGMIGSFLVRKIIEDDLFCRVILPVRDTARAEELYKDLSMLDYQKLYFIEASVENLCLERCPELEQIRIDDIIHCACVTQSKEMLQRPVETADGIVLGTKNILELARIKQVDSMVYLSSMEVYGRVEDTGEKSREEELGSLALEPPRNCYPMGKRMAEHYCHIYHEEYGVPVKTARLAQTFGRCVRPGDQRIYMQLARAVHEKKDIVLRTRGLSVGNYCHIQDAAEAVFCILNYGKNGETYNVVNEKNTMSIREMAELVIKNFAEGQMKVVCNVDEESGRIYAADTGLRMSSEKLRALGWSPKKELVQMYQELLEVIQKEFYV